MMWHLRILGKKSYINFTKYWIYLKSKIKFKIKLKSKQRQNDGVSFCVSTKLHKIIVSRNPTTDLCLIHNSIHFHDIIDFNSDKFNLFCTFSKRKEKQKKIEIENVILNTFPFFYCSSFFFSFFFYQTISIKLILKSQSIIKIR